MSVSANPVAVTYDEMNSVAEDAKKKSAKVEGGGQKSEENPAKDVESDMPETPSDDKSVFEEKGESKDEF